MNNSQTSAYLMESISAQETLMNGNNQFCREENTHAEESLEELLEFERSHGNKRLLKIYSDALAELRGDRR